MSTSESENDDCYNPRIELNADGSNEQELMTNLIKISKSYNFTDVLAITDLAISKKLNLRLSRELQLIIDENKAFTKENEDLRLENQKSKMDLRREVFYREKINEW
jgi:hypothetical protein